LVKDKKQDAQTLTSVLSECKVPANRFLSKQDRAVQIFLNNV